MAKLFKCDFCGGAVEHEHELRHATKTAFQQHPHFSELYPELKDADICGACGQAAIEAEHDARPQLLDLIRASLAPRRAV